MKQTEARDHFKKSPSLSNFKEFMKAQKEALQDNYNKAPGDHRYHQGRLNEVIELLKLITEATENSR